MSAVAAAYPKLRKIYKELVRQNETIFAAEKERNALEEKQGSLKGLSKLTKKGELQPEIDRLNERIDLLKAGLSGIVKRYGYQNVQDFYRAYHKSHSDYTAYGEQAIKREEMYGEDNQRQDKPSIYEQLKNPPKKTTEYHQQRTVNGKDRGAR